MTNEKTTDSAASALSAGLGALPTMADAMAAGDSVLLNEQAALLRECRLALDDLLRQKPMMSGLLCGSTTLGNLRAELYVRRTVCVPTAGSVQRTSPNTGVTGAEPQAERPR